MCRTWQRKKGLVGKPIAESPVFESDFNSMMHRRKSEAAIDRSVSAINVDPEPGLVASSAAHYRSGNEACAASLIFLMVERNSKKTDSLLFLPGTYSDGYSHLAS